MTQSSSTIRPRRWLRRVAIALAMLGALVVVTAASIREVRDLALVTIAPSYARDANFVRFSKGPVEVFVLGTIHGRHLTTPAYSLAHLLAVVANMAPDLLLVESRPEELARGRWGDGPIEMPFAACGHAPWGSKSTASTGGCPKLGQRGARTRSATTTSSSTC